MLGCVHLPSDQQQQFQRADAKVLFVCVLMLLLTRCRFGSIGHRVATLARAYEMRVVALRRDASKSQEELDSGLLVRLWLATEWSGLGLSHCCVHTVAPAPSIHDRLLLNCMDSRAWDNVLCSTGMWHYVAPGFVLGPCTLSSVLPGMPAHIHVYTGQLLPQPLWMFALPWGPYWPRLLGGGVTLLDGLAQTKHQVLFVHLGGLAFTMNLLEIRVVD